MEDIALSEVEECITNETDLLCHCIAGQQFGQQDTL